MLTAVVRDPEPSERRKASEDVEIRLNEHERRKEFEARSTDELDVVIREFAERVARLERELKDLRGQLEQLAGDGSARTTP